MPAGRERKKKENDDVDYARPLRIGPCSRAAQEGIAVDPMLQAERQVVAHIIVIAMKGIKRKRTDGGQDEWGDITLDGTRECKEARIRAAAT